MLTEVYNNNQSASLVADNIVLKTRYVGFEQINYEIRQNDLQLKMINEYESPIRTAQGLISEKVFGKRPFETYFLIPLIQEFVTQINLTFREITVFSSYFRVVNQL